MRKSYKGSIKSTIILLLSMVILCILGETVGIVGILIVVVIIVFGIYLYLKPALANKELKQGTKDETRVTEETKEETREETKEEVQAEAQEETKVEVQTEAQEKTKVEAKEEAREETIKELEPAEKSACGRKITDEELEEYYNAKKEVTWDLGDTWLETSTGLFYKKKYPKQKSTALHDKKDLLSFGEVCRYNTLREEDRVTDENGQIPPLVFKDYICRTKRDAVANMVEKHRLWEIEYLNRQAEERLKRIEFKKTVLKESEEILVSRKNEYGTDIMPKDPKYAGNKNLGIYNFYGRYIELLDNHLKSKGITCNNPVFESSRLTARDVISQKEFDIKSLYKIKCRGMEFAFVEEGHRLWLIGNIDEGNMQWYKGLKNVLSVHEWYSYSFDILAALATDSEIYVLFQSGKIKSSNPDFQEVDLFKKIDEARRICAKLSIDMVLEKALTIETIEEERSDWSVNPYYSWKLKSFIDGYQDGSLDTGIYAKYFSKSKEYVLENFLVDNNLYKMWKEVNSEIVPRFAALDCLPEDKTVDFHDEDLIY